MPGCPEFFRPVNVKGGKVKKPEYWSIGVMEYWSDDVKNFHDILIS
jgi:hypothetical protein